MNWDDLKLVDAAARMRSLSGAAKALDISQPQLSRRLKTFENRIGARLFDRTPTGLKPTEAGLRLIPLAADMRRNAEAASRVLPDLAASSLKVVRIAVDEVRARVLTDCFYALAADVGDIELELISSHAPVNHQSRSIELQIRSCLPETDTLIARRIGEIAYAVYGSRTYVGAAPAALSEKRYADYAWLGFAPDELWYPAQARWLEQRLGVRPVYRGNSMTTLCDMTVAGAGLALLPMFMADTAPGLVRLTGPIGDLTFPEHIIVHRDLKREPAVQRAMDAVARVYRKMAPRLAGRQADISLQAAE